MPKCPVLPEESKDKEDPVQDSSVDHEEDDTGNVGGNNDLEEDIESEDPRGVGAAEGSMNSGANAGQSNRGNEGSSGNLDPPKDINNNGSGGGTMTGTGGMPQAGCLSNGTRYSIPFYDILISIGLMTANVRRMFQEDIRSADNFVTTSAKKHLTECWRRMTMD